MINFSQIKNIVNEYRFPLWFTVFVLLTILISIYTRIEGFGYSNFQGDEVNTVDFIYEMKDGHVIEYLFSQKRGPTQYIINLINVGIFGYHNELLVRLPYVMFGIFALLSFYLLSKRIFGKNAALLTSLIIATNGLFLAFSRITQYQAVMYCLLPLVILFFMHALSKMSLKKMAIAGLLVSFGLLTHYDTLSVFPFFIVMIVGKFVRESDYSRTAITRYLKLAVIFFICTLIPALAYYIPFTLHREFESRTSGYLEDRLLGGGLMPRTRMTLYLISMYIPSAIIGATYFLAVLSGVFHINSIKDFAIRKLDFAKLNWVFLLLIGLNVFGSVLSLFYLKPRLSSVIVILSSIAIAGILLLSKKVSVKYAALMTWFLGAYSAYFYIMKDPRTHVYVVFIPGMILAAYTLYKIYLLTIRNHYLSSITLGIISLVFVYIIGFNWMVFGDKAPEYPWFDKYYFGQQIFDLPEARHKKIDGVFGFNNWRGWEQSAELFNNGCLLGTFDSNEKNSITYFYMRRDQSRGSEKGFIPGSADNLIIVEGPHSWEYQSERIYYGYDLVKVIKSNDIPVTYIYSRNYNPQCFPEAQ